MRHNLFLGAAAVALIAPVGAMAQETTSTVRGAVTNNGAPVAGASVTVVDTGTNSRSTATTNASGAFNIANLRPGGPYTVEVTSAQGSKTVTDVYTVVSQPYDLTIELAAAEGEEGGDIVITASALSRCVRTVCGPSDVTPARDSADAVMTMSPPSSPSAAASSIVRSYGWLTTV